jgi:hypothetical protein
VDGAVFADEADLRAAERWVDDWQSGIEERAAAARALSERVAGLTATARSADGLVEVTVASSGLLTGLRLAEAIRRRPAAQTSAEILAVSRAALARLAERVAEAVQETVGRDSATGRAVMGSFAARISPEGSRDGTR